MLGVIVLRTSDTFVRPQDAYSPAADLNPRLQVNRLEENLCEFGADVVDRIEYRLYLSPDRAYRVSGADSTDRDSRLRRRGRADLDEGACLYIPVQPWVDARA